MKTRVTRQKEIMQEYIEATEGFFNAEEMLIKLQKKDKSISIATIYRNLKELVKKQQLFSYTCNKRKVYSKKKQHCHYIDAQGNVTHFHIDSLDFLNNKIPGKIGSISIEIKEKRN